jgi:hypothetical protein
VSGWGSGAEVAAKAAALERSAPSQAARERTDFMWIQEGQDGGSSEEVDVLLRRSVLPKDVGVG